MSYLLIATFNQQAQLADIFQSTTLAVSI